MATGVETISDEKETCSKENEEKDKSAEDVVTNNLHTTSSNDIPSLTNDTLAGATSNNSTVEPSNVEHTTRGDSECKERPPSTFSKLGKFFNKRRSSASKEVIVASSSTTGLILEGRPKGLPAKSAAEEKKHQKLYQEMIAASKKKELRLAEESLKLEQKKISKDEQIAIAQRKWSEILPKFESLRHHKDVRELWWAGLPPGVRGKVWAKAIANDLNISPELYMICLKRCKERLALADQRGRSDSIASIKSISRENSVEVIHLDLLRTFPTLGFFQEGGPYHDLLHNVLGAYACYRPDVGYVQGMSFLAAVLLLNMDGPSAFILLANLLNRSSYMAFFKVDQDQMQPYFTVFSILLSEYISKLSSHFNQIGFTPQFYLIEWIFTIYTRTLPLDVACRVWDLFCRDGDVFLYRTALGILNLVQHDLLQLYSIEDIGHFLSNHLSSVDCDELFASISTVSLTDKKFNQLLMQHK